MITCENFYNALQSVGIHFYAGVPDSLLKDICAYISDHTDESNHVITANEGAALSLAAGSHLATGDVPLVYLQNSGLGNLVNPLMSLTDPEVYAIPSILLIGWRGAPGVHDEPQHRKQGRVMLATLDAMEIPHSELPDDEVEATKVLATAVDTAKSTGGPVALIVRKGLFAPYTLQNKAPDLHALRREDALKLVLDSINDTAAIIATTGMTSREVFEYREETNRGHAHDFLTVGCMGHASQIAMGVAMKRTDRLVYCLDGDGALLMHLGALAIIGAAKLKNFRHVVINNGAHDSVGGQPTTGFDIDIPALATACKYTWTRVARTSEEIPVLLEELANTSGPALLEIRVNKGSRKNLGRPTTTTHDNKRDFMAFLQ